MRFALQLPTRTRGVASPGSARISTRSFAQIAAGSKGIPSGIGFTPSDIQSAYHLDPTKGAGQTVYIIDAFGYKGAAKDLAVYRAAAGLPACSGSCFKILNQNGNPKPLPRKSQGWDGEQSLDLDAVSAACPKCNIVLIQTDDNYSLRTVSPRRSASERRSLACRLAAAKAPADPGLPTSGVALVASAGDNGGGPHERRRPADAVRVRGGGLRRRHGANANGNSWSESTWNDEAVDECGSGPCGATGSACSTVVPKPSWQSAADCKKRAAADVSAVASPLTPLAIYNKAVCGGWCGIGGTSLSAPLISGIFALAGNASSRHAAMELWKTHNKLNDVTKGTNVYKPVTGKCASSVKQTCNAAKGYDGPTGWGTPNTSTNF